MMKKILLVSFLLGSVSAFAQVAASANGGDSSVWVGGEVSSFNSDFDPKPRLVGAGALVDYNLTPKYGVEGEARWLKWRGAGGQTQSDYLGGFRYRLYKIHRLSLNAKFLVGGVWIKYPASVDATGSYFGYAPGGFADYRLSRRLSIRGDYEYQILPSAPGFLLHNNGLTPTGFSAGVTYRLFGAR